MSMGAIEVVHKGNFGAEGVRALEAATPKDTGRTASSWSYERIVENGTAKLIWTNDNINDGANVAVLLQYGHMTGSGGYVEGIDYINPALRPVFEKLADDAWAEVTRK